MARALGIDPARMLDLSQCLNPFAPDVEAIARRHVGSLRRYPDPSDAAAVMATAIGVEPDRLLLTNGGSEAIALVAAELGGRVRGEPDFSLYPRGGGGPVWRSDPHTPSGRLAGADELADVWDEAFYPLATGAWTAGRAEVTVGSLTKTFACPGLRVGYLIAEDVARFARRQPQWSVGSLALAVVPELLAQADLDRWCAEIASARDALVALFERRGFAVAAADAAWVLVEAPGLRPRLAPQGVLVRDCASFGLPGWVRVAVTDEEGRARLEAALEELDDDGSLRERGARGG